MTGAPDRPKFAFMTRRVPDGARRAALLCAGLALLCAACGGRTRDRTIVAAEDGAVRIELGAIPPHGGRFFSYRSPRGGRTDFLVYRESDGQARAVLDACSDCYRWHKGYRLEEDGVVCVKCGMRFRFDELREGVGACIPIPLPSTRSGERLEIAVEALEEGTKYFRRP